MKTDVAIEEIRAVRRLISTRCGHDTHALLEHYREMEKRYPGRILAEPALVAPTGRAVAARLDSGGRNHP